jgi:hypothetical protein
VVEGIEGVVDLERGSVGLGEWREAVADSCRHFGTRNMRTIRCLST